MRKKASSLGQIKESDWFFQILQKLASPVGLMIALIGLWSMGFGAGLFVRNEYYNLREQRLLSAHEDTTRKLQEENKNLRAIRPFLRDSLIIIKVNGLKK